MRLKKSKSEYKKLREKIGKLHFKILLKERGPMCEICRVRKAQGRFHILSVGSHPHLEFFDGNILLSCWHPCHYIWHHDYRKARDIIEPRIKKLRGESYEMALKVAHISAQRHSLIYLQNIYFCLKNEMKKYDRQP